MAVKKLITNPPQFESAKIASGTNWANEHSLLARNSSGSWVIADVSSTNELYARGFSQNPRVVGTQGERIQSRESVYYDGVILEDTNWSLDITKPCYAFSGGHFVQGRPTGDQAYYAQIVGYPTSATSVKVSIGEPVKL